MKFTLNTLSQYHKTPSGEHAPPEPGGAVPLAKKMCIVYGYDMVRMKVGEWQHGYDMVRICLEYV